ncbi:hypothetical protein D9M71_581390 [compost metagenome]
MGYPQAGEGAEQQGFGIVGGHAHARGAVQAGLPGHTEAPGERRRQAVPVQPVMPGQFAGAGGDAAAGQVGGAGAGNAHHVGERCGDQTGVGQRAGAQHQVDLAQVAALQVDKAVDQPQLHVQARVGHQEVGNGRGQVAAAKRGRGVDAD